MQCDSDTLAVGKALNWPGFSLVTGRLTGFGIDTGGLALVLVRVEIGRFAATAVNVPLASSGRRVESPHGHPSQTFLATADWWQTAPFLPRQSFASHFVLHHC